ncbi:MAG: hypothetical protein RMI94_02565 [Bryobacterales bacterium]|nr:hypothetical protein [Bryobacteraceae bacterium]MDW8129403.1 hypothetical protein [Bryobacterales bacterium]
MKAAKVLLACLLAGAAAAQTLQIEGPISGFVFDKLSGSLRPILGLPGAAYVGEPVVAGLDWASVAPGGSAALVSRDNVLYRVDHLARLAPVFQPVENVRLNPDDAAWSDDGSVAAIYSARSGLAQVIRNARAGPAAGEPLELGAVTALAVDREGRLIAGTAEGVCLFGETGRTALLPGVRAGVLTVAGSSLFVAASGEVWRVEEYAAQPRPLVVAVTADPVGLALSSDGRRLFIAQRTGCNVLVHDLASRTPVAELGLDAEPSTLIRLSGADLWLLRPSHSLAEPLLVLKTEPEPSVWFIPAGKGE